MASIDKQKAIKLAYGILWHTPTDRDTPEGESVHAARCILRDHLDLEGRRRGIFASQKVLDTIRPDRFSQ